jgi:hypothetical protein
VTTSGEREVIAACSTIAPIQRRLAPRRSAAGGRRPASATDAAEDKPRAHSRPHLGAAVVKLVGALLPITAIWFVGWHREPQWLLVVCWIEALVSTAYGLMLTSVGLAVQAGAVVTSAHADRRALARQAFLRNPWLLAWGVFATVALLAVRS